LHNPLYHHAELTSRIFILSSLGIAQLLEQQPFADADASVFEEKYGTVSALLGEGAKPF
jgi:hypothetical protein